MVVVAVVVVVAGATAAIVMVVVAVVVLVVVVAVMPVVVVEIVVVIVIVTRILADTKYWFLFSQLSHQGGKPIQGCTSTVDCGLVWDTQAMNALRCASACRGVSQQISTVAMAHAGVT